MDENANGAPAPILDPHPVADPTIELLGVLYTIRYRASDVRRLSDEGIDIMALSATEYKGKEAHRALMLMLQHGVAHEHPKFDIKKLDDELDLSDLFRIRAACEEARVKALAQASAAMGKTTGRMEGYNDQIMANLPEKTRNEILEARKTVKPS